jgi:hypothetical protein
LFELIGEEPYVVRKKGEPAFKSLPNKGDTSKGGANFYVSYAEFEEFDQQKADAIQFLTEHQTGIREVMGLSGVTGELDFGIVRRDVAIQCDRIPVELLVLAGSVGLEIVLSQYPPGDGDDNAQDAPEDAANSPT